MSTKKEINAFTIIRRKRTNGKEERLTISLNLEARPGVLRAPLAAKLGIERPIDGFKADMALVAAAAAPAYPPNG